MTWSERGYAMAALLVGMSVMAIMLSAAFPVWRTAVQREREAELIFRGEQYAHAIELYSRRTGGYPASLDVLEKGRFIRKLYKDPVSDEANFQPLLLGQMVAGQPVTPRQPGGATGSQPGASTPTTPEQGRGRGAPAQQTGQTQGQPLGQPPLGQTNTTAAAGGPIIGVISRNTSESLRIYNGRGRYSEWAFVATATTNQAGAPGAPPAPGNAPGARGGPAGPRRGAPPAGRNPFGPPGPRGGAGPVRGGLPAK